MLELLKLNNNDNSITYEDIIKATTPLIEKYTTENNYNMSNFFQQVQNQLLEDIDDDDINLQYLESTQLGNLWKNQTVSQQNTDPIQANKVTDRDQKIQIFEQDGKYVMFPNTLGVNNDYQVPVAQGQINPNLKNITTRIINIDSQYRENIIPYNDDPDGPTSPTNFTLDLSDPIRKAISINVTAYQIPYSWYLIDGSNRGNNQFYITNNTTSVSTTISISSGNYTNSELLDAINTSIDNVGITNIDFSYNTVNGKTSIINSDVSNSYTITFYDSSNKLTNSNFSKINNNLGWILGFRGNTSISQSDSLYGEMIYTLPSSGGKVISESIVNTFGSKYFLLVLDDFQQNHLNQGLIGITPTQTNVDIPSYWNADLAISSLECQTQPSSSKKIPTYIQNAPRRLTQAQLYTLNSATQNRSQTTRNRLTSPNNSSVLALIPLKGTNQLQFGNMLIDDFNLRETERVYFGPVDLERFRVRLVDDQGYTVNLNGNNWSFTMNATCLYQY